MIAFNSLIHKFGFKVHFHLPQTVFVTKCVDISVETLFLLCLQHHSCGVILRKYMSKVSSDSVQVLWLYNQYLLPELRTCKRK